MIKNTTYKTLFVILFLFVFSACEVKNKTSLPSLEEDKMAEVLTMMYVNEVKSLQYQELGVQKDQFFKEYLYPVIFDSLNVVDSVFYQSYEYYNQHPLALKKIMDKVLANIEALPADTTLSKDENENLESAYKQILEIENMKRDRASERFKNR